MIGGAVQGGTMQSDTTAPALPTRRFSSEAILIAGCLIALLTFGPRSAVGAFQRDILDANGWTRDVFAVGLALQNLLWGIGQPFAGAIADRLGTVRVLCAGAVLYAAGLILMTVSRAPLVFDLSAGVLVGFGLSGCSFNLVLGAFGKLIPESKRSIALGFGTAAGSLGQFLFSPLAVGLIDGFGWKATSIVFGVLMLAVVPLSLALATPRADTSTVTADPPQSLRQALGEAFAHRSYVLLVLGFLTCGFQLAFVTVHYQIYLTDLGLSKEVGAFSFALIGIFNIFGSLASGWFGPRVPRRWILAIIYFSRSLATVIFLIVPPSAVSAYAFGAVSGLLWLSTVPPTSSLVTIMFGTKYLMMLYGFAFFSHQLGGFIGVLLGGIVYETFGSYTLIWWLSIGLGVVSALINLPIVEKPVVRAPRLATA
jgi:MFS family permease